MSLVAKVGTVTIPSLLKRSAVFEASQYMGTLNMYKSNESTVPSKWDFGSLQPALHEVPTCIAVFYTIFTFALFPIIAVPQVGHAAIRSTKQTFVCSTLMGYVTIDLKTVLSLLIVSNLY